MEKKSKDYPRYDKPFPKRIRELLSETNMPAQTLGDYLGISQQAVNHYSFGEAKPTIERLVKIAEYFKVTADYLLGLSDVKTYDIETQAASRRYGLGEKDLQSLERLCAMAQLHEQTLKKHKNESNDEHFELEEERRQAWQKLHAIRALLTIEQGEQALNEIGEYLYLEPVDGIVKNTHEAIERHISDEDYAKVKLFNVQECLVKVRQCVIEKQGEV